MMNTFISLLNRYIPFVRKLLAKITGSRFSCRDSLPYPISVKPCNFEKGILSASGGAVTFDQPDALEINKARLSHLGSLKLPIEGRTVLDVGCGVGHLAQFFIGQNCNVTCLDGRAENIKALKQKYPELKACVANVETDALNQYGNFDIVFSYGLLYHLENPVIALRNMASACKDMLLLETMVCDHKLPILRLEDESKAFSQALNGIGCRPSPSYVVLGLNRLGFKHVYAPKIPPDHLDFKFRWRNNLDAWRKNHPLRCIFIASRSEYALPNLVKLI